MSANPSITTQRSKQIICASVSGLAVLFPQYFPFLAIVILTTRRLRLANVVVVALALPYIMLVVADVAAARYLDILSLSWTFLAVGLTLAAAHSISRFLFESVWIHRGVVLAFTVGAILAAIQAHRGGRSFLTHQDPNLAAHSFVVGAALASLFLPWFWRWYVIGAAVVVVLLTGSRGALIGVFALGATWALKESHDNNINLVPYLSALAVIVTTTAFLGGFGERWNPGPWIKELRSAPTHNLIPQSDDIGRGHWSASGIIIDAGTAKNSVTLSKTSPEPWTRPQQTVTILSNHVYTLSVELKRALGQSNPGLIAVSSNDNGDYLGLRGELLGDSWLASISGAGEIVSAGNNLIDGGWLEAWITFHYTGSQRNALRLGPAPDITDRIGSKVEFRSLQLTEGIRRRPYIPGGEPGIITGWASASARLSYWKAGLIGFLEKPILGWGPNKFTAYYRQLRDHYAVADDHPSHSHNAIIQLAFTFGSVGLVAILLAFGLYLRQAFKTRHLIPLIPLIPLVVALTMNITDATLQYGGILYPVVFSLGLTLQESKTIQPKGHSGRA